MCSLSENLLGARLLLDQVPHCAAPISAAFFCYRIRALLRQSCGEDHLEARNHSAAVVGGVTAMSKAGRLC